ncbi:MAG: MFS transporter, partial [Chlamydiae bacterium]|nr:MFS transporter [Chlamydiota bacterium]
MSIIDFMKPSPHSQPIEDKETIDKTYKYWRLRIFYAMYVGYAFFYFTRKSFTFAMPALITELGMTKTELGYLASTLYFTYGISKFVSGVLSDKSNPRFIMAMGLVLTGIFNIFFGFSNSFIFFALFWGLNGWFQGWGWPPCARLLTHWYSQKERGTWWGIWNTSHNIGGALIPLVVAEAIKY